ncbi:MAG: oligosaccharide flippase family protein [candidate division Zixibacteria bacterium]|nr:oligosaccharide flippase family protein [candidate division Zixibacteria bacterium]
MLAEVKKLVKHSMIYGLGSLLNRLLGFVLLPIYTRYLTPTDYGILSLLVVTGSVAGIIVPLGFSSAMFREVIYQESDERTVESTALYFLVGESVLFFGALITCSPQLSSLIFDNPEYAYLLRLVFLTGLLNVSNAVVTAKLRIHEQSALYSSLFAAKFLIGAMLNIYFIVVLQRGVEGLITAGLILAAMFAVVHLMLLIRDLRPTFSIPILRRMLSFGVPLVPFGLAHFVMTYVDRYFLQHFSTAAEVGIYSLGYNFGMVIMLLVGSIQLAWPARMFTIAKKANAEWQFAKMLTYYLLVLGFIALVLSVLAHEVLAIMTTPRFYEAYTVVPLIALSYVLYGAIYLTNTALETQNRIKYMSPIIVICAALNSALNYLLIPHYGMMGAAWATVITYLALVVIQTAVNLHFWFIPYEYRRIGKITLVWGMIYAASLLIQTPSIWLNGSLKLVLVATYPFFLYLLRFYQEQELSSLKRTFQSRTYRIRTWGTGS